MQSDELCTVLSDMWRGCDESLLSASQQNVLAFFQFIAIQQQLTRNGFNP
jgi:hypothetical protein